MIRALFFGRSGCIHTDKALAHLKHLGFGTTCVVSERRGQQLPENTLHWKGEYIFCFRSFFLLPKKLIDRSEIAAINFHPAPTEYPGNGCLNFALYDQAKLYGVTAHLMNEKIDNGTILECRRFPILHHDNVDSLLQRTHHKMLDLFFDITNGLYLDGGGFLEKMLTASETERWNGPCRRISELEKLRTVDVGSSKQELDRTIRATHTDAFPTKIHLHGYDFFLRK